MAENWNLCLCLSVTVSLGFCVCVCVVITSVFVTMCRSMYVSLKKIVSHFLHKLLHVKGHPELSS